ncbi:hypothetical protein GcM1_150007 [Golovinomyces cichoracearum]|uniref:Uncharacterized protein n=1 Tax=Golovinomyces cichoracearum TaxID=62708 RepID=A0A420JAX6_9PEZI|nr:hypothetical protein GcM1_150007 [Golovinomyces cichoracearum]
MHFPSFWSNSYIVFHFVTFYVSSERNVNSGQGHALLQRASTPSVISNPSIFLKESHHYSTIRKRATLNGNILPGNGVATTGLKPKRTLLAYECGNQPFKMDYLKFSKTVMNTKPIKDKVKREFPKIQLLSLPGSKHKNPIQYKVWPVLPNGSIYVEGPPGDYFMFVRKNKIRSVAKQVNSKYNFCKKKFGNSPVRGRVVNEPIHPLPVGSNSSLIPQGNTLRLQLNQSQYPRITPLNAKSLQ